MRCFRSKGYNALHGEERIEVRVTSRELFERAKTALVAEKRRRRNTGGEGLEFLVILVVE